ncbi:hypothetical protein [Trinickia dinghuensis]|uniref:hypothetical protein n=1 Tax=Trinickia dinghuensis TaxID=2291023 RepID=UPI0011C02DC6|nr:hypothetical protein [Trinickia dinghuensis]
MGGDAHSNRIAPPTAAIDAIKMPSAFRTDGILFGRCKTVASKGGNAAPFPVALNQSLYFQMLKYSISPAIQ